MKIITAHIKKACAEKRIIMEKIKKNVSNIKRSEERRCRERVSSPV